MSNQTYKVILLKTPDANDQVVSKLAGLFKITPDKALNMLSRDEFVIKKQTDKQTAEKFHKAISAAGARCKIEEVTEQPEVDLPAIEEIATPKNEAPLIDPTRPGIKEEHPGQDQALSLQAMTKNNTDDLNANVDPECFCPMCGTIRESGDAVCKHCGYDPVEVGRQEKRASLIKIGMAAIVLLVVVAVAYPLYLKFSQQMQVKDDLNLAFDIRNQVTEFIQRTNFWPNQNIDAGLDKDISNRSIKSVTVGDDSVITVTLRAEAAGGEEHTLVLTPGILKGRIVWNCLKGSLPENYRPDFCRSKSN